MNIAQAAGLVPSDNSVSGLMTLFNNLVQFALLIVVPLAALVIVYGGFRIIISGGNPSGKEAGYDAIKTAVIGVAIVFGAWIIIKTLFAIFGIQSPLSN